MIIETKYNIEDEVWVMHDNKAWGWRIERISYMSRTQGMKPCEQYQLHGKWFDVSVIFPTKEELLKSL